MTGTPRGGSRILGTLGSADGKGVVRMQDRYDTDIDDLWAAITDPAAWPAGWVRWMATSASAGSSAPAFSPADGRAPGRWKPASRRGGCGC